MLDDYDIRPHCRFETEVVGAVYDEATGRWAVTVKGADGTEEVLDARFVVSAVGALNQPKMPDIPGMDDFAGPSFHSARWDPDVDWKGTRFALVGAGASGFQIAPTIADDVESLTIFQRTAQWMFPNAGYHSKVPVGRAVGDAPPALLRSLVPLPHLLSGVRALDGPQPHRPRVGRRRSLHQRGQRPDPRAVRRVHRVPAPGPARPARGVASRTTRRRPSACSRTTARGWPASRSPTSSWSAPASRRSSPRASSPPTACSARSTSSATPRASATTTSCGRCTSPGKGGVTLREQWGDEPTAYLGITVPNFPNLFCLYGPGTNLAHGASLIFQSECQVNYA